MSAAVFRSDEALSAVADKILSADSAQRLAHERRILGTIGLEQRALQLLLVRIVGDGHLFPCHGVDTRIIHDRRGCARCGIEILHLLGRTAVIMQIYGKLDSVAKRAARMARHKIRNKILVKSRP